MLAQRLMMNWLIVSYTIAIDFMQDTVYYIDITKTNFSVRRKGIFQIQY